MFRKTLRSLSLFVVVVSVSAAVNAQSNLLQNPDADRGGQSWRALGESEIETTTTNETHFLVRNGGYFLQDVELPKDAAGKYILFIGHGASERINADGAITGLPYLYGYLMRPPVPGEKEILAYLQGQQMLAQTNIQDEWVTMWGIFEVPEGTTKVRFFLNQALRAGVPHNGSAARFDHLGLYLFATRKEAQRFVREYQ
ncbi:MAG TPA: hypothetical protein VFR51_11610 [Pyrinomonadaceae bacterium]|nr:hypothetical protein [Pyrinomonadaceae bacterium]